MDRVFFGRVVSKTVSCFLRSVDFGASWGWYLCQAEETSPRFGVWGSGVGTDKPGTNNMGCWRGVVLSLSRGCEVDLVGASRSSRMLRRRATSDLVSLAKKASVPLLYYLYGGLRPSFQVYFYSSLFV